MREPAIKLNALQDHNDWYDFCLGFLVLPAAVELLIEHQIFI